MVRHITFAILFFISFATSAQEFSSLWQGHFSYYDIRDITHGNDKIFAASENAIFSYDLFTNELQTITTVEGLSGETISTIEYSEEYQLLIIGFENGLIEILDDSENEILSVVDIVDKQNISPAIKRINHFNVQDELVYIATDYGISVYDLSRLEFGDTYFMGNGGTQIIVYQTTIFDGSIYASCGNLNGLKKGDLDNPNLIDYQQWQTLAGGNFRGVQQVGLNLYALRQNRRFYSVIDDVLTEIIQYSDLPTDLKNIDEKLVITTESNVFVYDSDYNLISNATVSEPFDDTEFVAATITDSNIYIGTTSYGVLETTLLTPIEYTDIRPQGPFLNSAFKIEAGNGDLWVTYGDYSISYNPSPLKRLGISHLRDDEWTNISRDSVLAANNLNHIAINPFRPSQVFISSFRDGILELNDESVTQLLNHTNSGLEPIDDPANPNINIRQSGMVFDRNGVLWTMTSRVDRPLKSFDPASGQWQGFNFQEIIPDGLADEPGFGDIVIDGNGTKWIGAFQSGLIGFSDSGGNLIRNINGLDQNMPNKNVRALAIDSRNQLWIGTIKGIRVLYNTSNFFDDPNPSVSEIIIVEDGLPQELLQNQFITDIKVDGSNNKWVGTLDSGIFLFSPDGQETIYHFTKDNSPVPSNTINDISIDDADGRVYIATAKGLVSFLSGGSKPEKELGNAFVYPNPVRPEYDLLGSSNLNNINKGVKIKGLTENVNIKITDIEGNLVTEAQSGVNLRSSKANYNFAIDGGTAIWNGRNLGNNVVASGVYLILISDLDSFETKVLKLLIIR